MEFRNKIFHRGYVVVVVVVQSPNCGSMQSGGMDEQQAGVRERERRVKYNLEWDPIKVTTTKISSTASHTTLMIYLQLALLFVL